MGEKGVSVKKLLLVDGAIQFSNQRSNKQLNHGGDEQRQKMPWEKEIEGGGGGKGSRSKSEETKTKDGLDILVHKLLRRIQETSR